MYAQQDEIETYFGAWRSLFSWRAYAGGRCWANITRTIHALPRVKPSINIHGKSIWQMYHNIIWNWFFFSRVGPASVSFVPVELLLTSILPWICMHEFIILSRRTNKKWSTDTGLIFETLFALPQVFCHTVW